MSAWIACCLAAAPLVQDGTQSETSRLAELQRLIDWNRALTGAGAQLGRFERLLEGLSLRPVVLSEGRERGEGPVIGVEYDVQKHIAKPLLLSEERSSGLVLDFVGRGTLAFEKDQNPHDLLETGVQMSVFGTFGSRSTAPGELERRAIAGDAAAQKEFSELLTRSDAILAEASAKASSDTVASHYEAALSSDEFREFLAANPEGYLGLASLWTWHADLKATYETNQEFTERQGAFGVRAGATGFSDDPQVNGWNVLDYPFVLTRWLTGREDAATMTGHFPRVTLGVDLVDPEQDADREAAGEDLDAFGRFSAEVGFVSDFGTIGGRDLKASATWRYFEEIDASNEVEDAGLDRAQYAAFALTDVESGVFFSYATGKLPLDADDDSVFAIGWNFSK